MLVTSVRRVAMLLAPLLIVAAGLLAWLAHPAHAANKDVTITANGDVLSCEAGSYAYAPANVTVNPGDTVTFTNPSSHGNACPTAEHPTRCSPETQRGKTKGECPFSGKFDLNPGASHRQAFPSEGTFQLQCIVHPYMLMTVVVGDGEPDPEPEPEPEPEPKPTQPAPEPTQAEAEPTEPDDTPAPTPTNTGTGSPAPEQPTETEATIAPTETATDPIAEVEIGAGGSSATRGGLLVVGTALLGFNIAMLLGARNPARFPWLP